MEAVSALQPNGGNGQADTGEPAEGEENADAMRQGQRDTQSGETLLELPLIGWPLGTVWPLREPREPAPVEEREPATEESAGSTAMEEDTPGLAPVNAPEVVEFEPLAPEERERWEQEESGEVIIEEQPGAREPDTGHDDRDPEEPVDADEGDERQYRIPGPCGEWEGDRLSWYDRTHGVVSETLCWPSRWFDNFFGEPDARDAHPAGTFIRLTGAQAWQDDGVHPDRFSYSASVNLPRIQERLSLVFTDDETDREDALLRRARVDDEGEEPDEESVTRAGFRYVLRAHEAMDLDTDLGVRGGLNAFARVRYRERWPLNANWHLRTGQEFTWREGDGWDSVSRLDLDRALGGRAALRLSTRAEWVQQDFDFDGWYWRLRAGVGVQLTSRAAIDYSIMADGYTRPHAQVENYRLGSRFRRNFWRPWLFYELEPFVRWSRDREYSPVHGVWFRLEVRLGLYDY